MNEETQPKLTAGEDRPAPPPDWQPPQQRKDRGRLLLWIAGGMILIAIGLSVWLVFDFYHFADEPGRAFDPRPVKPGSLSSAEIIQSLAPAAGEASRSGSLVERSVDLNIEFELNSAGLLPEAERQLQALGSALTSDELKALRFEIAGHTDASGSPEYNLELSAARAETVAEYLQKTYAVERGRLLTSGYGESRLKDTSDPLAASNRRVEVRLIWKSEN